MGTGKVSACAKSQQNVMLTQVTWGARQRCARVIHLHCTRPSPRQMVKIRVPSQLITRSNVSTTCCQLLVVAWNSSKMESSSSNCLTAGTERRLRGFPCQRKPFGHQLAPSRIDRRALLPSVVGYSIDVYYTEILYFLFLIFYYFFRVRSLYFQEQIRNYYFPRHFTLICIIVVEEMGSTINPDNS